MFRNSSSYYNNVQSNSFYDDVNRALSKRINPITIGKFFDEYVEYASDPDEFSLSYQRSINLTLRHFRTYFGEDCVLSTITEREYENFFRKIKQNAPRGFRVYYRTLKAVLSKALKWGYLEINYLKDDDFRKKYRPEKKKPIFINKEDLKKILDTMADAELKRITLFAYYTGCRVGEIVNIKWYNIDFSQNMIRVGDSEFTPKDKEDREIPFSETLRNILEKQKNIHGGKSNDYVFINQNGKQFRTDNISKRFKKAVRKAEVNHHITFHKLRASFITNLANKEVSIAVIQQLSGHSSLQAITPYLSYEQKHLRDAIMKLEVL